MRMFLVEAKYPYHDGKWNRESVLEQFAELGISVSHAKSDIGSPYSGEFMITETQMVDLVVMGINFDIKQQTEVFTDNVEISHRMSAIAARLDNISNFVMVNDDNSMFNQKCNAHQPGNMLSHYNETLLLEDSCTDYLQEALDKGWRIIVACPQPDTRRADYVLGRYTPSPATNGRAHREI